MHKRTIIPGVSCRGAKGNKPNVYKTLVVFETEKNNS